MQVFIISVFLFRPKGGNLSPSYAPFHGPNFLLTGTFWKDGGYQIIPFLALFEVRGMGSPAGQNEKS
jgi:hypothetical protein